jgi:uncharacterized membrane protein YtjA (UPF0391 family)
MAEVFAMLRYAVIFFVVAIVAGAMGFWGLENTSAWIAKMFFIGFLVLAAVTLVAGRRRLV